MSHPKVYADFQNLDDTNRLRLNCAGTIDDLARQCIELKEGMVLTFYMDDANEQGEDDELQAEGIVHHDERERTWVASIDWSAIRHASDDGKMTEAAPKPSDPGPSGANGPTSHGSEPPSPAANVWR
jgi:hypothetical protein